MPAPKPADMEDCSPKLRCTHGEYIDVAYDPADPCEEGQTFNVETCSCDPFEPCDCSCDNDCGECEICDPATGTCIPDPACFNPTGGQWWMLTNTHTFYYRDDWRPGESDTIRSYGYYRAARLSSAYDYAQLRIYTTDFDRSCVSVTPDPYDARTNTLSVSSELVSGCPGGQLYLKADVEAVKDGEVFIIDGGIGIGSLRTDNYGTSKAIDQYIRFTGYDTEQEMIDAREAWVNDGIEP